MDKYFLSVNEAIKYFGLGRNSFYKFCKEHKNDDFILMVGNKMMIKREQLEEYFKTAKSL